MPKEKWLIFANRSQVFKFRYASNQMFVSVYRVPQMQGVGHADVLSYFKCPTTKQMRCAVNAYHFCYVIPNPSRCYDINSDSIFQF